MKKTGWIPASVLPVHSGVYEMSWRDTEGNAYEGLPFPFHFFNGKGWVDSSCAANPKDCAAMAANHPEVYGTPAYAGFWRGLAEKPE